MPWFPVAAVAIVPTAVDSLFRGDITLLGLVAAKATCAPCQANPCGVSNNLPNLFLSSLAAFSNPWAPPRTKSLVISLIKLESLLVVAFTAGKSLMIRGALSPYPNDR